MILSDFSQAYHSNHRLLYVLLVLVKAKLNPTYSSISESTKYKGLCFLRHSAPRGTGGQGIGGCVRGEKRALSGRRTIVVMMMMMSG